MAYRRFFIEGVGNGEVCVAGDLFRHIRDVCRFKEGDRFEALPGDGAAILMEIVSVGKRDLRARALSARVLPALEKPYLTLALSLPKMPKTDWIIEKCVELGVREIRPFVSDYSFLRDPSEVSENRMDRWRKIAQAATQQSGRGDVLAIAPIETLSSRLEEFNRADRTGGLFPYEGDARQGLKSAVAELKTRPLDNLWMFVGSEGGFSKREVDLFAACGLPPVSMGTQILRVETACVALISVLKYEYGHFEHGSV